MLKALDGLTERAAVTAQNIANGSTPGYRPLRLKFEEALKAAAAQGPEATQRLAPSIEPLAPGAELRPDLEVATASTTALRYSALVEVLNRELQLNALAITGNN
jgi:flagellar basal-body rod protein FlgB